MRAEHAKMYEASGEAKLCDALEWLLTATERIIDGEPVRNMDEILMYAHTVLKMNRR